MRAIGITEYGGPEVLRTVDVAQRELGATDVTARVRAAGINPVDVMLRTGALHEWNRESTAPYVPGMDVAGVVEAIGAQVDGFAIGDPVVGIVDNRGPYGAYAETVTLPAASVSRAPKGSSHSEAASYLMPALTARAALDELALPGGASLLVTGAAGGVGTFAVALGKGDGLHVTALAREADRERLLARGADEVITDIDAAERTFLGVIDAAHIDTALLPHLATTARIADLAGGDYEPGADRQLLHVNVRARATDVSAIAELLAQVESGELPIEVAAQFAMADVRAAHDRFDRGGVRGRIVLTLSEGEVFPEID